MNVSRMPMKRPDNCDNAHEIHLCYMLSQGFHLTDERSYAALVTEPKYCCSHCGRQAASLRNLCVPIAL